MNRKTHRSRGHKFILNRLRKLDRELGLRRPSLFFNREGKEIDIHEFADLSKLEAYVRVAHDIVGDVWISTIWVGVNMSVLPEETSPRGIFETIAFGAGGEITEQSRYSTEIEAIAGHQEVVNSVRKFVKTP